MARNRMPRNWDRLERTPLRNTEPLWFTQSHVDRRCGMPDQARRQLEQREAERAPRGRR